MRRPVNQAVKRFLEGKSLPEHRFARLNEIAARSLHGKVAAGRSAVKPYWGIASAVVIVLALTVLQYQVSAPSAGDVHQSIADEVATNHIKLKPLEVRSSDMREVRTFFSPLSFTLVESSLFEGTPWRMMGGRFCTIRGEAAAQLRMQDVRGEAQTVYQVSYNSASHHDLPDVMRGEEPVKLYSRGFEVRLWRERGLLFAAVSG